MCSGWLGSYGGGCGGAGALRRLMASSLIGSACVPCTGWASAVLLCRMGFGRPLGDLPSVVDGVWSFGALCSLSS